MSLLLETTLHAFSKPELSPMDVRLWREPDFLKIEWEFHHSYPPVQGLSHQGSMLYLGNCFEVFLSMGGSEYLEWNLSPDGQWSTFAFSGYRIPKDSAGVSLKPLNWTIADNHSLELILPIPKAWARSCNITAITDRGQTFWAHSHPPAKPDFHDPNFWLSFD